MSDLLTTILHSSTTTHLGWTLLHSLWQDTAIAALLFLILTFLPKSAAQFRYLAAATALLLTLFLPLITFQYLNTIATIPTQIPAALTIAPSAQNPNYQLPITNDSAQPPTPASIKILPTPASPTFTLQSLLPTLVTLWTLGVLLLSLYHLGGWIALQRLRTLHNTPAPPALLLTLSNLAHKMHITRPLTLSQSPLITTPLVIGFLRPLILLPTTLLTGLSPAQLQAILAHELAHIRRHDYLVNLLQTLIETLLFYHPAIWWISAHIRQEREHCCDDLAASLIGDPLLYAEALLSIEELRAPNSPPNNLALAATGGHLFTRIQRLITPASPRRSHKPISLAAILLTLLLLSIPLWPTHQKAAAQTTASAAPAVTMNYDRAKLINPIALITGTLLETGTERPVPGARVDISGGHDSIELTTDTAGRFSLKVPAGRWDVEFRQLPGTVYLSSPLDEQRTQKWLNLDASTPQASVTFHIPPVLTVGPIHGKLLMPDGSPAAGVSVVPEAENSDKQVFSLSFDNLQKTAPDGSFTFKTAPLGEPVHIYAEILTRHLAFTADVQTQPNLPDQDIGTFTLQPTQSADILFTDAHNQPLANIDVNVQPTYGSQGLGNMTRKFTTDSAGHLHPDGILPNLHYKLHRPKANTLLIALLLPAPTTGILDDLLPIHVVDSAGKPILISAIHEMINNLPKYPNWDVGQIPEIKDRLPDGTILIDAQQGPIGRSDNNVVLYFTAADGLPRIAAGLYTTNNGRLDLVATADQSPAELDATPMNLAADEYAGHILDAAGNPIPAAAINAPNFQVYTPGNIKTLATTDAAGFFHITPPIDRDAFYFQIDKPGYARRWLFRQDLPKGKPFNVRLDNTTRVQADLHLPDNSPAAGATFTALTTIKHLTDGRNTPFFQTTLIADANGHIDLPLIPGVWEFRTTSADGKLCSRNTSIQIQQGQTLIQPITLAPGVHLKIHVLDSITNKPLKGARLSIATIFPAALYPQPGSERTTDSQGFADWPSVMPGTQWIQVAADGYARWFCAANTNQYSQGLDELELNITPNMPEVTLTMEPGMRLTGKVLTLAGAPVPDAHVNLQGIQNWDQLSAPSTNANGEFSFLVPATRDDQNQPYTLVVLDPKNPSASPKASSEPFKLTIGGSKSFTLTIPNP